MLDEQIDDEFNLRDTDLRPRDKEFLALSQKKVKTWGSSMKEQWLEGMDIVRQKGSEYKKKEVVKQDAKKKPPKTKVKLDVKKKKREDTHKGRGFKPQKSQLW